MASPITENIDQNTSRQPAGLEVGLTPLHILAGDERLAWDALYEAQQGPANPFCAPEWVETWYRHFTEPADQVVITVRMDGELIGVAPFFRNTIRVKGIRLASRLQLVGAGQGGSLLELPQILATPGQDRTVTRAVVAETMGQGELSRPADWTEIAISRAQGWFEPEWVARTGRPAAFFQPQMTRACVMIALAGTWSATKAGFKRNIKESLRRSRNRLAKDSRPAAVHERTVDLDVAVVDRFLNLHQSRAEQDVAVSHHDAYADPARRSFLRELLPRLGRRGRATIYELELDHEVVAAQLVLHAPGLSYIHSSGFRSDVWALGPVTHLQGEAIAAAADRGEQWINMSPGPNVAKLRWSEQFLMYDDFAYGCGPRSLRWRYQAFAAGQTVTQVNHQFTTFSDARPAEAKVRSAEDAVRSISGAADQSTRSAAPARQLGQGA